MKRRWQRLRERLDCSIHGHRDLARAAAYAETRTGSQDKELHYCGACGGPAWLPAPRDSKGPRSWAGTGLPNP